MDDLEWPRVPIDAEIDFGRLIERAGVRGVVDLSSIRIASRKTGETIAFGLGAGFADGDLGRLEWVATPDTGRAYEIRFSVVEKRPSDDGQRVVPAVGVGDLLRYGTSELRPIALAYPSGLTDVDGDGLRDLVGCWNYAHRPGEPWDGVVYFPRVGSADEFRFGEMRRVRFVASESSGAAEHFRGRYMHAAIGDLNDDGAEELVFAWSSNDAVEILAGSGRYDSWGCRLFIPHQQVHRGAKWSPCRVADLDGDGDEDLVVGSVWIRNADLAEGKITFEDAAEIDIGAGACFYDVDGDGRLDAVCLADLENGNGRGGRVVWRRNLGGEQLTFDAPGRLEGIESEWCTFLAAVREGPRRGLLVQEGLTQSITFYEDVDGAEAFRRYRRAESRSAVMSLGDQAWPYVCDWDGDGDLDLLVGGGYGWPRIVINEGTREAPAYAEARTIMADGQPIRLLRDEILGGSHWHNMGYSYPVYVDWNGDELPDLILPNETNRIFWYANIGSRGDPIFGARQQILCDGYPDGPESRAASAGRAGDDSRENSPYPYEDERPFFWRTGAAVADFTGDGLPDLITQDGAQRKATLFAQYESAEGGRRLRKVGAIRLEDERLIDDSIVERKAHWTESFRAVDWDRDGRMDLVYSLAGAHAGIRDEGSMYLLLNCGTRTDPVFAAPRTLRCYGEAIRITNHGPHPWVGDYDGDGLADVLACVEWSVYPFYTHAALEMSARPKVRLGNAKQD